MKIKIEQVSDSFEIIEERVGDGFESIVEIRSCSNNCKEVKTNKAKW